MWNWLRNPADRALGGSIRFYCNHRLQGWGEMTEFAIDTTNKTVRLRLDLAGEPEPIELQVTRYALLQESGETRFVIEEAVASRAWMTLAIREYVVGKTFPLPAEAAKFLKFLA